MQKFWIETASTVVRTASFVGMIMGNSPIKVVSAIMMIAVNVSKAAYEWRKARRPILVDDVIGKADT